MHLYLGLRRVARFYLNPAHIIDLTATLPQLLAPVRGGASAMAFCMTDKHALPVAQMIASETLLPFKDSDLLL